MKRYVVTGLVARFNPGQKIQITKEQAAARLHNLSLIDKKNQIYEVKNSVEFKTGEVIGFDDPVNKAMLQEMEEEGSKKARKIQQAAELKKQEKQQAPQETEEEDDTNSDSDENQNTADAGVQITQNGKLAV